MKQKVAQLKYKKSIHWMAHGTFEVDHVWINPQDPTQATITFKNHMGMCEVAEIENEYDVTPQVYSIPSCATH